MTAARRRGRPPPGRGRHRHRMRRRDLENLLRHLRQGPLLRLRRRQPAQRPRRPEAVPRASSSGWRKSGGTPTYARPMCVGEVRPTGQHELEKDIAQPPRRHGRARRAAGLHERRQSGRHLVVPAERFLPDPRGLPRRPRRRHGRRVPPHRRRRPRPAARLPRPRALAPHALRRSQRRGIPQRSPRPTSRRSTTRSTASPRSASASTSAGATTKARTSATSTWPRSCPVLMKVRARHLLFETANPRHGHEWTVFRDRRAEIPDDRILVPGVVDTTTNFVEHPELVAQRLERFVDIVGARPGDRRLRLRLRHLRRLRRRRSRDRLGQARHPRRGRPPRPAQGLKADDTTLRHRRRKPDAPSAPACSAARLECLFFGAAFADAGRSDSELSVKDLPAPRRGRRRRP